LKLELKTELPVPKNKVIIEHSKLLVTKDTLAHISTKLTNPLIFSRIGKNKMLKEPEMDPVNGHTPVIPLNMVLPLNKCLKSLELIWLMEVC
jgi:hypothetical protein